MTSMRGFSVLAVPMLWVMAMAAGPDASQPAPDATLVVWRVGSPHNTDVPSTAVPLRVAETVRRRGFGVVIESFPAGGFAARFHDAVSRGAAPDLLAIDNFGVIEGITTPLGRFDGIRENPDGRGDLLRVTRTLDELIPGGRGWVYLIASSPNYEAARRLAISPPSCSVVMSRRPQGELAQLVPRLVTDYLERKVTALAAAADPERLSLPRPAKEDRRVLDVAVCGMWGNRRLAFVQAAATYDGEAVGQELVLVALRNVGGQWRLLVASRDVISNQQFVQALESLPLSLDAGDASSVPSAALLLAPPNGQYPKPTASERFGWFEWQTSLSTDLIAEVVEFTFGENARLFLTPPGLAELQRVSAGSLLSGGDWIWRVWSISRPGEVAFSEARAFSN
jgi:hypothetical protein